MLTNEQKELFDRLLISLNPNQKIWLAGYFAGITASPDNQQLSGIAGLNEISQQTTTSKSGLTVLYGSRSGNSEFVAKQLVEKFKSAGILVKCTDMTDYKLNNLKNEKFLVVAVSTHGEGVPPVAAEEFYEFLHSKRAPKFEGTRFAVCALGDSSYEFFCKAGIDIDKRLTELGAERILEHGECDVDFEETALAWVDKAFTAFQPHLSNGSAGAVSVSTPVGGLTSTSAYTRKNPFRAMVLDKILLSGRGSKKENYHIEVSLEGSGLTYQPGDAIGIMPENSNQLVDELISTKGYNPTEIINNGVGSKDLKTILLNHYELSVLSKDVVSKYADLVKNNELVKLTNDNEKLHKYAYGRDVLDLMNEFPAKIDPLEMLGVLRKLQPRLYSIASSQKAYPDEVHLTVGTVRYESQGRKKVGTCSAFLADRIEADSTLPVFVDVNKTFRLPDNNDTSIIMIGPGTGIAPFRSFIQDREADGATGKNWLFFGDQHFRTDFLYQTEWQKYLKQGLLTRMDVAFSRDQKEKIYVQQRLLEKAKDIYAWLQEGASIYVCGDMSHMAADVYNTLITIAEQQGGLSNEAAKDYIRGLQKARRYQEDVY